MLDVLLVASHYFVGWSSLCSFSASLASPSREGGAIGGGRSPVRPPSPFHEIFPSFHEIYTRYTRESRDIHEARLLFPLFLFPASEGIKADPVLILYALVPFGLFCVLSQMLIKDPRLSHPLCLLLRILFEVEDTLMSS